jgi:hypothetical protein
MESGPRELSADRWEDGAMKSVVVLVLGLLLLVPPSATAGPLYGTVRMGQEPVQRVDIFVACPGFNRSAQAPASVTTDARGSFALRVEASGRCEMRVRRGNQTGSPFEVFVSNNPVRLDIEIDRALNRVGR